MPEYIVTYIKGMQGFGEETKNMGTVNAFCAMDAIRKVTDVSGWTERDHGDTAALLNPEAANKGEDYCDYYFAELAEQ